MDESFLSLIEIQRALANLDASSFSSARQSISEFYSQNVL